MRGNCVKKPRSRSNFPYGEAPKMRGLKGCTEGRSGPVKIILKDGKTPEQIRSDWWDAAGSLFDAIMREQEQAEQEYTHGCPF